MKTGEANYRNDSRTAVNFIQAIPFKKEDYMNLDKSELVDLLMNCQALIGEKVTDVQTFTSTEIEAKEETYPGEFCLWVAKKCCNQEMSVTPEELFDFMGNEYTLPDLFKYWTDNVKGK